MDISSGGLGNMTKICSSKLHSLTASGGLFSTSAPLPSPQFFSDYLEIGLLPFFLIHFSKNSSVGQMLEVA